MPIERIELYELTLPLLEPFIISGGTMTERRSLVVVLHDDQGNRGYGESPPFELPFYSEETLVSARDILERVLIPRLMKAGVESPEEVDSRPRWNQGQPVRPGRAGDGGVGSRGRPPEHEPVGPAG